MDWNPDNFKWWAGNIGEQTKYTITHVLESKKHPEQAYKSCMGILGLAKKHGNDLLELTCRKAINIDYINYGYISDEIKKIQDRYSGDAHSPQKMGNHCSNDLNIKINFFFSFIIYIDPSLYVDRIYNPTSKSTLLNKFINSIDIVHFF